ncbi:hypothetical protein [Thermithiobacillus plumbiphilus]|uniref:Uncharacterized protein n=1 Tax=Thermithiobacillus plumbiphilus TaxID=1729899 RepID=A0ABU9D5H0_9PROT
MAANPAHASRKPANPGTQHAATLRLPLWAAVLLHHWAGTDQAIRSGLTFLAALGLGLLLAKVFPAPWQETTAVLLLPLGALFSYHSARLCRLYRRAQ